MLRRTLVLTASVAIVVSACTSGDPNTSDQAAVIYSAVLRVVLADTTHPTISSDTSVFVAATDARSPLPLEVQADIVDELHRLATIRFVDDRTEAIDDSSPRKAVNDNGILVTLGKIPNRRNVVTINAVRYVNTADTVKYRVTLERTNTRWKPIATTSQP